MYDRRRRSYTVVVLVDPVLVTPGVSATANDGQGTFVKRLRTLLTDSLLFPLLGRKVHEFLVQPARVTECG